MRTLASLILVASLAALEAGCGGCGDEPLSLSHLDSIPDDARTVALVDLSRVAESLRSFSPFRRYEGRWSALGDDLNEAIEARFGVGLLDAQGLVAWGIDEDSWGVVILGDFDGDLPVDGPEIDGHRAGELGDGTLFVVVDGELLAGSRAGLERMLAVADDRATSLGDSDSDDAQLLSDLLDDVGGEILTMAAVSGDLDELLRPVAPGARGVAASISDRAVQLRLRLADGDAASDIAGQMRTMLEAAVASVSDRADSARDDETEDLYEVLWAIAGDHAARLAADELVAIGDDGDDVVVDLDLTDLGGGVGMIGVLAAVAIPQFLDYVRRSKTSEARVNVRQLYDGARSYYAAYGQIPEAAPRSPSQVPCGAVPSRSEMWSHPTWEALGFRVEDDLRYSYQFDVQQGEGGSARFTASAFGDLDCDGDYSTFYVEGRVDADGPIEGDGEVRVSRELE